MRRRKSAEVRPQQRMRPPAVTCELMEFATLRDAPRISELRNATAAQLTNEFGSGPWSGNGTFRGVRLDLTRGVVCVVGEHPKALATLTLTPRKPWAIDQTYFSAARRPLYLMSMAVAPGWQRTGVGRRCIDDALNVARAWPADAIRLDAYDAAAGAGEFYRKCGFREVGRVVYRRAPLIYFEFML
jgi:GNAT superfamily N-acetyltransferase